MTARSAVAPPGAGRAPLFLASVTSASEAGQAVDGGADIVDAKNPSEGALGALPVATVRMIRTAVPLGTALSATIGDGPADGRVWVARARDMVAAGADFVKIGIPSSGDVRAAIAEMGRCDFGDARVVGVLAADQDPDFALVAALAEAGFAGVMLDTVEKEARALPDCLGAEDLRAFLAMARRHGLFAGLAGSLRIGHVSDLAPLGPDILGFRGALCVDGARTQALDPGRVGAVRDALRDAASALIAATSPGRNQETSPA